MRNVHIVTVGFDPHPSLEMLASGDVDHVYLLNDRNEEKAVKSEKKIRRILDDIGTISYEIVEVDCYDYQNVYDMIIQIAENERDSDSRCKIHINFSRGTAIAVGAACTAACTIKDVDLYYSKWRKDKNSDASNRIIHVDTSEFAVIFQLKGSTREVFKQFGMAKNEYLTNTELLSYSGLERNSLTYHTKKLVNLGLIEKKMDGRKASWHVTKTGRKVLKRILR